MISGGSVMKRAEQNVQSGMIDVLTDVYTARIAGRGGRYGIAWITEKFLRLGV